VGNALGVALTMLGADLGRHLGVHDPFHQHLQGFPQEIHIAVHATLAQ